MPTRTNLGSTRRTVTALRKRACLGPEHEALVALAESTARSIDAAIADPAEKKYAVAQLARAHLEVVRALLAGLGNESLDPFAALVSELSTPTRGLDGPVIEGPARMSDPR
jgi:hypothetical protein